MKFGTESDVGEGGYWFSKYFFNEKLTTSLVAQQY